MELTKSVTGVTPDQRTKEIKEALQPGPEAVGYAMAQSLIAECIAQGNVWNMYVARLSEVTKDTRESFMKHLNSHIKEMRAHVKEAKPTPEAERYAKAMRSAQTRISQLVRICKAMEAGYILPVRLTETGIPVRDGRGYVVPVHPFDTNLADAALFLESEASGGRGRPKKPWLDKLKKFILDNQPDFAGNVDATVVLVQQMAELTKKAQAAAAKTPAAPM